ncbi:MAG TPA: hypothetical protein VF164_03915 [Trueperaceae bacterium]
MAAAGAPLLVAVVALVLAIGVIGVTEAAGGLDSRSTPKGLIHGWVSPTDARVLLPASVCPTGDGLSSLRLEAGSGSNQGAHGADLTLEPPAVLATGAAIDRLVEVKVLDVGAGMAALLASSDASLPTYTRAAARCRSFVEHTWDLGTVSVSRVDASLEPEVDLSIQASPALSAYIVPEPHHTGVLALLLVTSYERPVELVSLELGDPAADAVLAASGWMEHWESWEDEALAWRGSGRSTSAGSRRASPPGTRDDAGLSPTEPAPPLTWHSTDDLGIRLEPYHAAAIVLGEWTFGAYGATAADGLFARAWHGLRELMTDRPEVVLTFPVLTYRVGGQEVTVGMEEPLYADLR